ncbi:MAG: RNA polymerase sigma-70 factor [Bacteroidales bacterium]|nr:RNA polymerase sigma-70 factor [Bacteroidales bacterium]
MIKEKELSLLIQQADKKAFEVLFRLYYVPLLRYAKQYCQSEDEAQDIVQETFINVWEQKAQNIKTSLKAYLYTTVRNKAFNLHRHEEVKQKHQQEVLHTGNEIADEEKDNSETYTKILLTIEKLPGQCRRVFIMSRLHGLKHHEIAEDLQISVKTVKNHIGKALKILRENLGDVCIGLIISVMVFLSKKM